jgi:hypothetical protein
MAAGSAYSTFRRARSSAIGFVFSFEHLVAQLKNRQLLSFFGEQLLSIINGLAKRAKCQT